MWTVTIATQKGGAAKTTICSNLAVSAQAAGLKTIVFDIDPQESATRWGARRERSFGCSLAVLVRRASAENLPYELACAASQGFDLVLIDTPGTIGPTVFPALELADLALIPAQPSCDDLESALPTARVLYNYKRPFAYVLVCCPTQTQRVSDAEALLDRLCARAGEPIRRRVAYQDAFAKGLGVIEWSDPAAAQESRVLWEWTHAKLIADRVVR